MLPDFPEQPTEREWAWLGDAVLALYVREHILRTDKKTDGAKAVRMSSNQFLSALGNPTSVEASIGRLYHEHGLDAAFEWIQSRVVPLHEKQETKRRRQGKS